MNMYGEFKVHVTTTSNETIQFALKLHRHKVNVSHVSRATRINDSCRMYDRVTSHP